MSRPESPRVRGAVAYRKRYVHRAGAIPIHVGNSQPCYAAAVRERDRRCCQLLRAASWRVTALRHSNEVRYSLGGRGSRPIGSAGSRLQRRAPPPELRQRPHQANHPAAASDRPRDLTRRRPSPCRQRGPTAPNTATPKPPLGCSIMNCILEERGVRPCRLPRTTAVLAAEWPPAVRLCLQSRRQPAAQFSLSDLPGRIPCSSTAPKTALR